MGKLRVGTLTGQHVALERLRADHLNDIVEAGSGDRSTFGLTQVPANRDEAAGYISHLLDDAKNDRCAPFVQRQISGHNNDNSVLVGCTRFMNPHWWLGRTDPDEIEIGGTWINFKAQRTPLNTEAKILMLTHAFETWSVQRVAICTDASNSRSRQAIERIGASFEGVLRRHRQSLDKNHRGILRDSAMYSITNEDWPAVRAHLDSLASR